MVFNMKGPGIIGAIAATYLVKKGVDEIGKGLDDEDDDADEDE
jgi:hypothetical protein